MWRDPTDEETKYLLSQLRRRNFFDGAQWIAIYGILIFCFLAPLNSAIRVAMEMDPKRIIFVIGNALLTALFALCIYACRDELIRIFRVPGMYRRGEIEITSGVLLRKWKKVSYRSASHHMRVQREDGPAVSQEVSWLFYRRVCERASMIVVRVKSDDDLWKGYYGFYEAE